MEDIALNKILILIMCFVPGYVYMKTYRLLIAETKTDFSKDLYEAIGISLLNLIIFSYPIYLIYENDVIDKNPFVYYLFLIIAVLCAPILYAMIFNSISKSKLYCKHFINPTKSAWDSLFSNKESYFVIITLKSGRKIAGKYGKASYSSTYPNPNEIYLEEVYKLNEDESAFGDKVKQTEGILITEKEISTIEFFI